MLQGNITESKHATAHDHLSPTPQGLKKKSFHLHYTPPGTLCLSELVYY